MWWLPQAPPPSQEPSPSPASAMALAPIGIAMAPDSDCAACHMTTTGVVGTKPIPKLAHPLWGWRECTACHANDSLVQTAPGHSGLHKDDCLVCHQASDQSGPISPAPLRPEPLRPPQLVLPLRQSAGVANQPVVRAGDTVQAGQPLGKIPDGALGALLHAPLKAKVSAVTENHLSLQIL